MHYEMDDDRLYFYLDGNDNEQEILRALVRASYDWAPPDCSQLEAYDPGHLMRNSEAITALAFSVYNDPRIIFCNRYLMGRLMMTTIYREGERRFSLDMTEFLLARGLPHWVIRRMQDILAKKDYLLRSSPLSFILYQGMNLDYRLKNYGQQRITGEDDWSFRKRVFPVVFVNCRLCGMQFLLGSHFYQWDEQDMQNYHFVIRLLDQQKVVTEHDITELGGLIMKVEDDPLTKRWRRFLALRN